jgi:hypothetical protein
LIGVLNKYSTYFCLVIILTAYSIFFASENPKRVLDIRGDTDHNGCILEPLWRCFVTTFTVKNIPPDLYERLKKSAELNRRSINSEIIICIEKSVQSQALDTNKILAKARKLRSLTQAVPTTDDELIKAIEDGRT